MMGEMAVVLKAEKEAERITEEIMEKAEEPWEEGDRLTFVLTIFSLIRKKPATFSLAAIVLIMIGFGLPYLWVQPQGSKMAKLEQENINQKNLLEEKNKSYAELNSQNDSLQKQLYVISDYANKLREDSIDKEKTITDLKEKMPFFVNAMIETPKIVMREGITKIYTGGSTSEVKLLTKNTYVFCKKNETIEFRWNKKAQRTKIDIMDEKSNSYKLSEDFGGLDNKTRYSIRIDSAGYFYWEMFAHGKLIGSGVIYCYDK
ncbi:MAG: hypothetical protein K8R67_02860 [Desulfobacteraceae bacterium]|nr:hypothetical protein [Desulfobacteraceae bacterium]